MSQRIADTRHLASRGFVSMIGLVILAILVIFMLAQTLSMSGSKAIDAAQYADSLKALAAAETGREAALAGITQNVELDDTQFTSSCSAYDGSTNTTTTVGSGQSFRFVPSNTTASDKLCPVRVQGNAGKARRTLEGWINFSNVIGVGDYGSTISMTLNNPYGVPAVAVFDLAWRRSGSLGGIAPGTQADAFSCTLPGCQTQWNFESSSGKPSVGSLGTSVKVAANSSAEVIQTLSASRDYSQVGLIVGGFGTTSPTVIGKYFNVTGTANTKNQDTTYGTITSGEFDGWCAVADTIVFGVSGRGTDDGITFTATYTDAILNTGGTPSQPIALKKVVHYPNTDGTSPNTYGDVFAEVWYTYNPYVKLSRVTSDSTTPTKLKIGSGPQPYSVNDIKVGTVLKVFSGNGVLQPGTKVVSLNIADNSFTVDKAPSTALNNDTICGGICAFFDDPGQLRATKTSPVLTSFSLTRATAAAQQWAGGFVCFSGVDPTKVRKVSLSGTRIQRWHEVITGE